jgi:hypothetical protein
MLECYRRQMQQQNMNINQDITTGLIMYAGRQKRSGITLTEQLQVDQLMQADSTLRLRQNYPIRATAYCFYSNIKCMSNTT